MDHQAPRSPPPRRALRITVLGMALAADCSVLIETAQYVPQLDRVSSVDDVLLNADGAALATLASRSGGVPGRPHPTG